MTELLSWLDTPLGLATVKALYLPYVVPAYAVILWLLVRGRLRRAELSLLACTLFLWVIEVVQLHHSGLSLFGRETMGIPRYLGIFAPFVWVFLAGAVARGLWAERRSVRIGLRLCFAAAIAWLVVEQDAMGLWSFYRKGARYDTEVAAEKAARAIRLDYAGPSHQERFEFREGEYFSPRRPVVFSDFAAAAWLVRGQSGGALQRGCPYKDDYLFVRVGSGYAGTKTVDARQYDYLGSVTGGLGFEWRLFRRKTTPHRLKAAAGQGTR